MLTFVRIKHLDLDSFAFYADLREMQPNGKNSKFADSPFSGLKACFQYQLCHRAPQVTF